MNILPCVTAVAMKNPPLSVVEHRRVTGYPVRA
jgi:hypothetical protein